MTRTLADSARTVTAVRAHRRLRSALVALELALTVVLLVGAGLFVTSFVKLMRVDLGFDADRLLTATVNGEDRLALNEGQGPLVEIVDRVRSIPGVEFAAVVAGTGFPVRLSYRSVVNLGSDSGRPRAYILSEVSADYHRVFRSQLLAGRYFEDDDIIGRRPVALLSEQTAKAIFPDREAVGQQVQIDGTRTVVGVVKDVRGSSNRSTAGLVAYLPLSAGETRGHLVIRTAGDPVVLVPAVRSAVHAVLPSVPLRDVSSMASIVSGWDAQRRLTTVLLALFGGLGLVIATVGVYGLMAYVVAQRTYEIGVRMALGATPGQIVTMFVRGALWITVAGLALGTLVAWWFSSAATAFLFELEPTDPRIFGIAIATLAAAAIIAAVLPARRAASIDPVIALRH